MGPLSISMKIARVDYKEIMGSFKSATLSFEAASYVEVLVCKFVMKSCICRESGRLPA